MVKITSEDEFKEWLKDKPTDWAQVIAARLAMRVFPIALFDTIVSEKPGIIQSIWRCMFISWAARNFPTYDMRFAGARAAHASIAGNHASTYAVGAASYAVDGTNATAAVSSTAAYAYRAAAYDADAFAAANPSNYKKALIWNSINDDAEWLATPDQHSTAQNLTHQPLWLGNNLPDIILKVWNETKPKLVDHDKNYSIWIDWYERRLRGEEASFDIIYDVNRIEDREIIKKLANATDEGFWSKGAAFVNQQLHGWIQEAISRNQERRNQLLFDSENFADDIEIPAQEESVTAYTQKEDGKIDHAPATEENRLRDIPDARQSYADLRKKAQRLLNEGQRLGNALQGALQDFMESMPEDFNQALAYNIWRDGTELREIYDLHKIAAKSSDYEPDKLDEGIATKLNGVLSLFNNLAFDDDGLRQRDERIPPQQAIQHAAHEAQIAQPITEAAASDRDISTEAVRAELGNLAKTDDTDKNTPYASQQLIEQNKVKRNFFARLFTVAKKSAVNAKDGAEREVGKSAIKFIINNKDALKEYVTTAYANLSLAKLIDRIAELFGSSGG